MFSRLFSAMGFDFLSRRKAVADDYENQRAGQPTIESTLQQIRQVWDEVGKPQNERKQRLGDLDREILNVFQRMLEDELKDRENNLRVLDGGRVELNKLLSTLGEDETYVGIRLDAMCDVLDKLWKDYAKEVSRVRFQIQKIEAEISGTDEPLEAPAVDVCGLSLRKLDELKAQLQDLEQKKSELAQAQSCNS